MVWAVVYVTWKYRLKPAFNNQSGLLMRPNREHNVQLSVGNFDLHEMQQFVCV